MDGARSYVYSIACLPLIVHDQAIGVINITNKQGGMPFSSTDIEMLQAIADQAALAINRARLWEQSVTDSLTGLFIRRYLMTRFNEEIVRAKRYGRTFSILMADLDRFKQINDRFGHTKGDQVLRLAARRLAHGVRESDILARYGGEEFIMLLPEAAKPEAFRIAERLRKSMVDIRQKDLPSVTISIGVATFPQDGGQVDDLIEKADAALYRAKREGRNRVA